MYLERQRVGNYEKVCEVGLVLETLKTGQPEAHTHCTGALADNRTNGL